MQEPCAVQPENLTNGANKFGSMEKNKVTGVLLYKDECCHIQGCIFEQKSSELSVKLSFIAGIAAVSLMRLI
jgi:hypothetical protein